MKEFKRNNLVLIIIVIFLVALGIILFKYKLNKEHINVSKIFENSLVIVDKINSSNTLTIEIAAKICEGSVIEECKSRKAISGIILIGNKKYELNGLKCCKSTNNTFVCTVKDINNSSKTKYVCYIPEDLSSIVLESQTISETIVNPANDIDEALSLKSKILLHK